jgi:hypothetical protein
MLCFYKNILIAIHNKGEVIMDSDAFKQGMIELYQGELLGEVLFENMLSYFKESDKQYKISVMLQLETETKARLRPVMMLLGLELGEQNDSRKIGLDMANAVKVLSWKSAMEMIRDIVKPVVDRYREIASESPPEHRELTEYMVLHEQSLLDFTMEELAGEDNKSIDAIVAQLHNKLPTL